MALLLSFLGSGPFEPMSPGTTATGVVEFMTDRTTIYFAAALLKKKYEIENNLNYKYNKLKESKIVIEMIPGFFFTASWLLVFDHWQARIKKHIKQLGGLLHLRCTWIDIQQL